jgi:type IX secretion system PorP/SprF family membrane protein
MKLKFNILGLLIALLTSGNMLAQQEAMFTHYSFNTLSVNPAYAGSRDVLTITGLHRSQWVNFPGAPITQTVTVHSPINKSLGIGLSLINDAIGPSRNTGATVDLSYRLRLGEGYLAFGLKAGLSVQSDKLAGIATEENEDPLFQQDIQSRVLPNFGAGVYYYTPNYFVGVSTPRVLENDYSLASSTTQRVLLNQRHFYAIAGAVFKISDKRNIKLKPTVFVKSVAAAPISLDLTVLAYFNDRFWVGPMVRYADAIGLVTGVNITNQFNLGYAYDWSFANTSGRYNAGSHELMLRYDFVFNSKEKIESPRYF